MSRTRAALETLPLYRPSAPGRIDLGDNTNLWGASPAATAALAEASTLPLSRYPGAYAGTLKEAIAGYLGVDPARIVTGCGSDDVLDAAFRALADPGDRVAFCDPTFSMVQVFARTNGLDPVGVAFRPDWDLDADALLATRARLLYVCSPNNPTGTGVSRRTLERLIAAHPGVVIVDEAYVEFARDTFVAEAASSSNVLVLRTLSKAFGLAGLRVGYAVGAPELVQAVEKARGPYKVGVVSEHVAVAALTSGRAWVEERVADALESRERLVRSLQALGYRPLPSAANFVLVPVRNAAVTAEALLRTAGLQVRAFTSLPGVGDALRITVGPLPLMTALIDALRRVSG